jgi:branched-chain amino acid transport system permease protein
MTSFANVKQIENSKVVANSKILANSKALANSKTLVRYKIKWIELVIFAAPIAAFFLLPSRLALGTSIIILGLFAMSCDLIIGFAGVVTLGQAMYFGIGAYSAALIAKYGWTEAISGALASAAISAAISAMLGPFLLRLTKLPLLMVTLGISVIVFEAANKAAWLTGGADGLSEYHLAPLLGYFRWSIFGHSKYLYVLSWLAIVYILLRLIVSSPFGVALQGIRENPDRMLLMGCPTLGRLVIAYVIAGAVAGLAGAVSAQTDAFVGLGSLSIDTTMDGLVVAILGGIGTVYGPLIGAPVYVLVKNFAQQWDPYYWMPAIGALLVIVVRTGRAGLVGLFDDALAATKSAIRRRR